MTIELHDNVIYLKGRCGVEQVEDLLRAIGENPGSKIDLRASEWLHTALWQVLMMTGVALERPTDGSLIISHILSNFGTETR